MPNYDIWKILSATFLRKENPYTTLIVSIAKRKTFLLDFPLYLNMSENSRYSLFPDTDVLTCLTLLNPKS